jgi:hypothetical protein
MLQEHIVFNASKMHKDAVKRIKDRNIVWKERYTSKSLGLKKKYDSLVGHNSYFRWEGHDYTTDSDYYVVVGPSVSEELGKAFFSGIRKMPAEYSPSGEYFRTIREALRHAHERWGVKLPIPLPAWSSLALRNINIAQKA